MAFELPDSYAMQTRPATRCHRVEIRCLPCNGMVKDGEAPDIDVARSVDIKEIKSFSDFLKLVVRNASLLAPGDDHRGLALQGRCTDPDPTGLDHRLGCKDTRE